MMLTKQLIDLQNWYILSLQRASKTAYKPGARDIYKKEAAKAANEFYETYGVRLPCDTMMN